MVHLWADEDIRRRTSAAEAVEWMREAVLLHHAGALTAPSRLSANFDGARLVVTAGRVSGRWYGYRTYDTLPVTAGQQVVVVHDDATGEVLAVAVGNEVGPRRTGALGGVAAQCLAPIDRPVTVALIGAGRQAWTQLWALNAVAELENVRVFSRTESTRHAFVGRARSELAVPATPVADPRSAVRDADIVVLATNSPTPVIDCDWLSDDVLVTTLGPKQRGRAEFAPELVTDADQVVTDSLAQLNAYDPPAIAGSHPGLEIDELGALVAGAVVPRRRGRRVFLSVGLAGTEVHFLGRLSESR